VASCKTSSENARKKGEKEKKSYVDPPFPWEGKTYLASSPHATSSISAHPLVEIQGVLFMFSATCVVIILTGFEC
jgi:hypothetical protein